jgi:putative spermidine/putrescine transport system substrate-binding protein
LPWLKGYCHPIRFNDLVKSNKVPAELLSKLPPGRRAIRRRSSPTLDQQTKIKDTITKQWDSVVGVTVK